MSLNSLLVHIKKKVFQFRLKMADPHKRAELMRNKFYYLGHNVKLYTIFFGNEPCLISIHDNVQVASGVKFINHDVSVYNMARYKGVSEKKVDKVGPIVLYENSFVGAYSILMPNSSVGKNSVVAAGSIVTKHIPDGEVWGGAPCKYIMKTEEYANKIITESNKFPWVEKRSEMSEKEVINAWQDYFFKE